MNKNICLDNYDVTFEIWDTAGQERYRSLAPMYYRNAMASIIVFDITNKDSFNGAKYWIDEIVTKGNKNCQIFLIGNKIDLESKKKSFKIRSQFILL